MSDPPVWFFWFTVIVGLSILIVLYIKNYMNDDDDT